MIKIMVADDHNLMIDGIKTTLSDEEDLKIVAIANNGIEVIQQLEKKKIDIILMDINMPGMDGLDCTKIVTENFPNTRVIALSQFGESRFVKRMIKNGAKGYLLKDASKFELVEAIRIVYNGGQHIGRNLQPVCLKSNVKNSSRKFNMPELSEREIEIIALISHSYSTAEIAELLSISFNTVERHRANMIEKTGLKNTAGLVKWALENEIIT